MRREFEERVTLVWLDDALRRSPAPVPLEKLISRKSSPEKAAEDQANAILLAQRQWRVARAWAAAERERAAEMGQGGPHRPARRPKPKRPPPNP